MPADERDRALTKKIRQVASRSVAFAELVEDEDTVIGELAFAEGLTSLMRLYWDTAEEMMGRASALYATHPWSSLTLPGPPIAPQTVESGDDRTPS
ncbi:hypothetical protein [Amycolatopsis kentuckyensis]|uniref:hypothetical protein n=1 Tax=Amycolatopsis kentuckyensis TaxID=218823 RepID=UPI0035646D68